MPTWLIVILVLLAVVPGALVILAGVYAMYVAPADYDLRRKRLAEGLCVQCGYDLRGRGEGGECPECGRRAPSSSASGTAEPSSNGRAAPP